MALIQWEPELSVGIAEIDQQHKKLIEMINDLNDAMIQGKEREILYEVIRGLIAYTKLHFGTEEKYFDQYEYDDREAHKARHKEFIQKVAQFRDDFIRGEMNTPAELMNFLNRWWLEHIKGIDKKYTAFFNSKGLR